MTVKSRRKRSSYKVEDSTNSLRRNESSEPLILMRKHLVLKSPDISRSLLITPLTIFTMDIRILWPSWIMLLKI